ncbi:MAG: hypothetical protein H8D56_06820 [Planctomycetes bacterium]|nr:hypothetical protein [Planctomycetota bacterium]MBL7144520.1 hypothetical protein [Phycisphaerae bacterium]
MNPADNIEHTIEQLHITTRPETDKHILDDAFVALEKSAQEQAPHVARSSRPNTLRIRIAELAAVAAVILVIFTLFFGTPAAEAVTFGEVIQALGKVRNVCVSSFRIDRPEPTQVRWSSLTMNIKLFKGRKEGKTEYALWDFPNRRTMFVSSGLVTTKDISADDYARKEKILTFTPGLIPITDINDLPEGSQWNKVEDPNVSAVVPGTEVYDLTYPQKSTKGTGIRFIKWRYFVDPFTYLPKRLEYYDKIKTDFMSQEKYRFGKYSVVTYPSENEIRAIIHNEFGPAALQPRDPGYIGTQPN